MQAESHSVTPLQSVPRTAASPDEELVPTVVILQSISC